MVPVPAPTLWALDTNSWPGLVGRNSLPNGPNPWAGNGEPGAAVSLPSKPTVKLSITEVPASVPASLVPVPLNSTSSGAALAASVTVEPGIGNRRPLKPSRKPVKLASPAPELATYTRCPCTATLSGRVPPEPVTLTRLSEPSKWIRSTEIWLLPAPTAIRNRPSGVIWIAPCEASPAPVPAPPATNGDPVSGVSEPSACRLNAPIVLVPCVLSLTYTCPTTGEAPVEAEAEAGTARGAAAARPRIRPLALPRRRTCRACRLASRARAAVRPCRCDANFICCSFLRPSRGGSAASMPPLVAHHWLAFEGSQVLRRAANNLHRGVGDRASVARR